MGALDDRLGMVDGADERHLFCGGGLEPSGYVASGNNERMAGRYGIRVPQAKDLFVAEKNTLLWWLTEWAVPRGLIR
jgi:hypothetical protein